MFHLVFIFSGSIECESVVRVIKIGPCLFGCWLS